MVLAAALVASPAAAADTDCGGLVRELKLAAFDGEWSQVLKLADELLAAEPACESRQRAAYLRAQALDRSGRTRDALGAHREFLSEYCPGEDGQTIDCQSAQVTFFDLAGSLLKTTGDDEYARLLSEGMRRSGDAGIFAALTLANVGNTKQQRQALPRLERAWDSDVDDDVRNRICLAVMRIDPSRALCTKAGDAEGESDLPQLISVEVFDKEAGQPQLRLNMPVALAEVVIKALPEEVHAEMAREGVDIRSIFQAIREQVRGVIFEAETEDMRIKIWLQ